MAWQNRVWTLSLSMLIATVGLPMGGRGAQPLERVPYNNPGLVVDLGVGLWAWPLPMDYDRDGDLDLVVSCPDVPYNGVYLFENPGGAGDKKDVASGPAVPEKPSDDLPVFKPGVRLGPAVRNIQISHVGDDIRLLAPGVEYRNFREKTWDDMQELGLPATIDPQYERTRANQWKSVDYDGDGDQDVIIGLGVWDDYGWDDAWDDTGQWTNGPLRGYVYLVENVGSRKSEGQRSEDRRSEDRRSEDQKSEGQRSEDQKSEGQRSDGNDEPSTINDQPSTLHEQPRYADPVKLMTVDGQPIDVYGMPSPNFADFDRDGDLDLICGEFLDGFTYFENVGGRKEPRFARGRRLSVRMDLQMITPVAIDWDGDGDSDLICGDEDGRVALIEHMGEIRDGLPVFARPVYFQQEAADVKFGALVTPVSIDWDRDGDEDLVCGNTAGYLGLIENLGGGANPVWNAPRMLQIPAGSFHLPLRHQAGPKGSIQGPCEAKWGYSVLSVADWNHDGEWDVIVNDIWGRVSRYRVTGDERAGGHRETLVPEPFAVSWASEPPKPEWTWWTPKRGELATQWRTTPCVVDWNADGRNDLVMLDPEGYLAFYERAVRNGESVLLPPKRVFKIEGPCEFDSKHRPVGDQTDGLLRLNANRAGASGRRKLCFADWDGDGRLDLLVNSVNVNWLRNVRTDAEGFTWFRDMGPLDDRELAGHTTAPTVVDWDQNGIPDLLVGAEDGYVYHKRNPRADLLGAVKLIDLDGDDHRQVVVDRERGQYLGHPTTVLLEDGRTMLCVYPEGHGRGGDSLSEEQRRRTHVERAARDAGELGDVEGGAHLAPRG